ncbi:glycosyltransferase family 2 protein [Microbacterium sp. M28]|uniref:glycosyltransferase family 2 protein n=1 Tax=Microbacterium sp. M28 TaxID=2962064 RepID=UPI0021F3FB3A|nr:glycosyltransferase family 2 protein [Microbacterium sp. M28]UYO96841.1 glycosyltransferase family 2 protein [Microbacterium sp. M28]
MNRIFQRTVGLAVIVIVLLAAGLLWWGIAATDPPTLWDPAHLTLAGVWQVMYSTELPNLAVLATALGIALLLVLFVVVSERIVASRYRRAGAEVTRLTLAPRAVMDRTRGVFAGEVTVTVLIPAHNEEASLPETLRSLQRQTTRPTRVIVVADNCTDGTVDVAHAHGADVFETVGNTHKKGGALNQALADLLPLLGDNDTVMVMDADSQIGVGYLTEAVRRFTADRALMSVGGLFEGEEGHGLLGQFQRNEYFRYQREIQRRDGRVFVLTGTASVFRASALRAVAEARGTELPGRTGDVYDTFALTEDNELTIAIKSLGGLTISPRECSVVTELMPSWRMLWAQRLRWQRGALENLGAYGVTPQTLRYWAQQIGIGYGVLALFSYFVLIVLMIVSMDTWVWFPFWLGIGALFAVERVITVWRGGWRARMVAALVFPELVYDCFLNLAFLRGVFEIAFGRSATWKHVEHGSANGAIA